MMATEGKERFRSVAISHRRDDDSGDENRNRQNAKKERPWSNLTRIGKQGDIARDAAVAERNDIQRSGSDQHPKVS